MKLIKDKIKKPGIFGNVMAAIWKLSQIIHCDAMTAHMFVLSFNLIHDFFFKKSNIQLAAPYKT